MAYVNIDLDVFDDDEIMKYVRDNCHEKYVSKYVTRSASNNQLLVTVSCKSNIVELERLKDLLKEHGFEVQHIE